MFERLDKALEDGSYKLPFNSKAVMIGDEVAGGANQLVLSNDKNIYWKEVEASNYEAVKVRHFMHTTWEGEKESRFYDPMWVEPTQEFKELLEAQYNTLSDVAYNMGIRWNETEEIPFIDKEGIAHLNPYMIEQSLFELSSTLGCDYTSTIMPTDRHTFKEVLTRLTWSWLVAGMSNMEYRLAKIDLYDKMLHRYHITTDELVTIFRMATRQLQAIQKETK